MTTVFKAAPMLLWVGCSGDSELESDQGGACGAVTHHELTVLARVVDAEEMPVVGAEVVLEDRLDPAGPLGVATTDTDGEAALDDLNITSIEGCWGVALDYVLVASHEGREAEVRVNPSLFTAIDQGESVVDRRNRPIVLP